MQSRERHFARESRLRVSVRYRFHKMPEPIWPKCTCFVVLVAAFAIVNDARVQAGSIRSAAPIPIKLCPSSVSAGRRVVDRLAPNRNLPEGITFATDWNRIQTGGWYGRQAVDDCRIHPDGFRTSHGDMAVRVEVQPHDDPLALNANSERAEMFSMQDSEGREIREGVASGTQYYATSYYFPTNWNGQQLPWSAFSPADCATEHQNACNSWSYVWQFYGWGSLAAAQRTIDEPPTYTFNNMRLSDGGLVSLGKWTDFILEVDWTSGTYAIWRRDEGNDRFRLTLQGTAAVPSGQRIYVKQGLYRGGKVGGRTDVLWIGPTVRGSSFSAVERQAFGTSSEAARDRE